MGLHRVSRSTPEPGAGFPRLRRAARRDLRPARLPPGGATAARAIRSRAQNAPATAAQPGVRARTSEPMPGRADELIGVLNRAKALLAGSEASGWAALTPTEVIAIVEDELQSLVERGRLGDRTRLASLFAPTSDVQEISLANRWGEEYLELSAEFDRALLYYDAASMLPE